MSEINDHISRIQLKLQSVLKQYELLQKEREKSKELLLELKEEREKQAQEIASLQQQNLVLKASLQSLEPHEKKALEQKLNQFLKQIDKSISLLS